MTGASLAESMIFEISASCAPFGCAPMIAARTPSSLAFSSDGGWTNETRFPPFFKTDQDRSCVSPPMSVEHNIDVARDVFESLLCVIDRLVHAELAQQILILGGGRRENVRAFPLRELHGEMTNSAAAGMNQHALARLQLRGVEQRLPRGQRGQRHGRRADVMKRVRFEREF